MARLAKHSKEWYRQAVEDLKNMSDAEILEKYGVRPRSIGRFRQQCKLGYATYGFTTPSQWAKTHSENELIELAEHYKTNDLLTTCMAYNIAGSFPAYLSRHGLGGHNDTIEYPDKDTIISLVKKYGSTKNLIDNLTVEFKDADWINNPQHRGTFVLKIRRTSESVFGVNVNRANRFGRMIPKSRRSITTDYNYDEAKMIIEYANSHTILETSAKFGISYAMVIILCTSLSEHYSIPYKAASDKQRDLFISKYKDYKNMTIDAFTSKYGYVHIRSAKGAMRQSMKRYHIEEA